METLTVKCEIININYHKNKIICILHRDDESLLNNYIAKKFGSDVVRNYRNNVKLHTVYFPFKIDKDENVILTFNVQKYSKLQLNEVSSKILRLDDVELGDIVDITFDFSVARLKLPHVTVVHADIYYLNLIEDTFDNFNI